MKLRAACKGKDTVIGKFRVRSNEMFKKQMLQPAREDEQPEAADQADAMSEIELESSSSSSSSES